MTLIIHANKSLGDFDSALWAQHGFDSVRADLLAFYNVQRDTLMKAPAPDLKAIALEQHQTRNSSPNNCFSFATSMIVKGNNSFGPHLFKRINPLKSGNQYVTVPKDQLKEDSQFILSSAEALSVTLQEAGIKTMQTLAPEALSQYQPIIALLNDNVDYHFIKPTFTCTPLGPRLTFSQKLSKDTGSALYNYNLEYLFQRYKEKQNPAGYQNPRLYLASNDFVGRAAFVDESDYYSAKIMLLSSPKQL